jgi:acetyl esterase/lipase
LPGRRSFYARRLLFRLAREGWVCISATYRLQPAARFPDELIDVKKVIAWARARAVEYGGDADRNVLAGSSFGARLATLAGFTVNDPAFQPGFERADTSIAAVVALYGYYGAVASRRALPSSPFDYADRGSVPLSSSTAAKTRLPLRAGPARSPSRPAAERPTLSSTSSCPARSTRSTCSPRSASRRSSTASRHSSDRSRRRTRRAAVSIRRKWHYSKRLRTPRATAPVSH